MRKFGVLILIIEDMRKISANTLFHGGRVYSGCGLACSENSIKCHLFLLVVPFALLAREVVQIVPMHDAWHRTDVNQLPAFLEPHRKLLTVPLQHVELTGPNDSGWVLLQKLVRHLTRIELVIVNLTVKSSLVGVQLVEGCHNDVVRRPELLIVCQVISIDTCRFIGEHTLLEEEGLHDVKVAGLRHQVCGSGGDPDTSTGTGDANLAWVNSKLITVLVDVANHSSKVLLTLRAFYLWTISETHIEHDAIQIAGINIHYMMTVLSFTEASTASPSIEVTWTLGTFNGCGCVHKHLNFDAVARRNLEGCHFALRFLLIVECLL